MDNIHINSALNIQCFIKQSIMNMHKLYFFRVKSEYFPWSQLTVLTYFTGKWKNYNRLFITIVEELKYCSSRPLEKEKLQWAIYDNVGDCL